MSVLQPIVDVWDGENRRIYLKSGVASFFPIEDLYREYRNQRKEDENLRKFEPLLKAEGNVPKGGGAFTPRYVVLLDGTKIVPFDESLQLDQLGDIITDDPDTDATLYDISGLTTAKPIFIKPSEAETIQLNSEEIEYSSFGDVVSVDFINGIEDVSSVNTIGSKLYPVKYINDAVTIANERGIDTIKILGNYTFTDGDNVEDFILHGQNSNKTLLTFETGALTRGVDVQFASVQGVFDDFATFETCSLLDIQFVQGYAYRCVLSGNFILSGSGQTDLYDCWDGVVSDAPPPSIDFNGSGRSLSIRNYHGDIELKNKTGPESVEININSGGTVKIDETVTAGDIRLTGSIKIVNNSTANVDLSEVVFPDQMQLAAFNGVIHIDQAGIDSGVEFPAGTEQKPVNNLTDAISIANYRKISTFHVEGQLVISDVDISGYTFQGDNRLSSLIVLSGAGNITNRTAFKDLILTGRVNGPIDCKSVGLQTLSDVGSADFPTIFERCIFRADVGITPMVTFRNDLPDIENIHFIDCVSGVPGALTSTIDINDSDANFALRRFGGGIKIINFTQGQVSTIEIQEGQLKVDESSTNGTLQFRGGGKLVGTTGGLIVDISAATHEQVREMWRLDGLDKDNPSWIKGDKTQRTVDGIVLDVDKDGSGNVTITRQ